jgi:putative toxin-antitoxin system antitoxin component (TIGR02293 family)
MTLEIERVAFMLGGQATLGAVITTLRDLRLQIEKGLPVESLDYVARHVATSNRQVTEIKHGIVPKTTLARRRRLTLRESEHLERLARITVLAEHVWEDVDNARTFLNGEQKSLGGARPVDLARSELGAREVQDLLARMEYSLPA